MNYNLRNIHRKNSQPPTVRLWVQQKCRPQHISGERGGGGGQKNYFNDRTNNQGTQFAQTERRVTDINCLLFAGLYAFEKNNFPRALFWSKADETATIWNRPPYLDPMSKWTQRPCQKSCNRPHCIRTISVLTRITYVKRYLWRGNQYRSIWNGFTNFLQRMFSLRLHPNMSSCDVTNRSTKRSQNGSVSLVWLNRISATRSGNKHERYKQLSKTRNTHFTRPM